MMTDAVLLRMSLKTTREIASVLNGNFIGRLVGLMVDVLWSELDQGTDSRTVHQQLDQLKGALDADLAACRTELSEIMLYNFARAFHAMHSKDGPLARTSADSDLAPHEETVDCHNVGMSTEDCSDPVVDEEVVVHHDDYMGGVVKEEEAEEEMEYNPGAQPMPSPLFMRAGASDAQEHAPMEGVVKEEEQQRHFVHYKSTTPHKRSGAEPEACESRQRPIRRVPKKRAIADEASSSDDDTPLWPPRPSTSVKERAGSERASSSSTEDSTCPFCSVSFIGRSNCSIFGHFFTHHTPKYKGMELFRCLRCETNFTTNSHEQSCSGVVVYRLGEKRATRRSLDSYRSKPKREGTCCPLCEKKIEHHAGYGAELELLSHHLHIHQDVAGSFFRCSKCPEFRSRSTKRLGTHIKTKMCGGSYEFHYDPTPPSEE